jgi:hypothetical protein
MRAFSLGRFGPTMRLEPFVLGRAYMQHMHNGNAVSALPE